MNAELFLRWFDLIFPPLMMVSLPLICFFIPSRPESEEMKVKARRLTLQMWLVAGASVAIYFVAYTYGGREWRQLWMLSFLQMPLMNKLMRAKNPNYSTPYAGKTRVATLVSRETKSTVPRAAWWSVWVLWGALGAIAAWGYSHQGLPPRLGCLIVVFFAGPALFLAFGPALVKTTAYEPEPMDPNESAELFAAYEKHRNARSWLLFSLPVTMTVLFGVCSVAIAWFATSPEAEAKIGLFGGIAGATVGAAGAVTGIWFGRWRANLNQKVRDLTAEQDEEHFVPAGSAHR